MDRELKENGRIFKSVKYRRLGYEQHLKIEALTQVDDIFRECNDGYYHNMMRNTRTKILNIENYQEFYEEL